jgi:N-acetyl-gamma-glutamylphosphate reductase
VVEQELEQWTTSASREQAVIDLSGAFKIKGVGTYGLVAGPRKLWDGTAIEDARLFANPGCIASAVICGLERSGVKPPAGAGLHITAVTAGSAAKTSTTGTVRTGVRWWDHPHVAEIERATGLPCASFIPVVDYSLNRGIIATISGAADSIGIENATEESIDVAEVQHTAALRWHRRFHTHPSLGTTFSVTAALDNLTFPAANAVRLACEWLTARGE